MGQPSKRSGGKQRRFAAGALLHVLLAVLLLPQLLLLSLPRQHGTHAPAASLW